MAAQHAPTKSSLMEHNKGQVHLTAKYKVQINDSLMVC